VGQPRQLKYLGHNSKERKLIPRDGLGEEINPISMRLLGSEREAKRGKEKRGEGKGRDRGEEGPTSCLLRYVEEGRGWTRSPTWLWH
jgi:hypothetical protein